MSVAIAALADLDEILAGDRRPGPRAARRRRRGPADRTARTARPHVAAASGADDGDRPSRRVPGRRRRPVRPPGPRDRAPRGAAPACRRDDRAPDGRLAARARLRRRRGRDAVVARQPGRDRDRERPAAGAPARARRRRRARAHRARDARRPRPGPRLRQHEVAGHRGAARRRADRRGARARCAELAAAARSIYVDVREAILGLRSPVVPGRRPGRRGRGLRRCASPRPRRSPSASTRPEAARRLELAPDVEAQVFRIVQEALTNVRKHAGARGPRSSSRSTAARLEVVIVDDGHGLGAPSPGSPIGRTTASRAMRERADSIGATVDWTNPAERRLPGPPRRSRPRRARRPGRDAGADLMRIVLADDHALFRDGVSSLLQAWGHQVVGRAAGRARGGRPRRPARAGPRPDGRPDAGHVGRRGDPGDRRGPTRDRRS